MILIVRESRTIIEIDDFALQEISSITRNIEQMEHQFVGVVK